MVNITPSTKETPSSVTESFFSRDKYNSFFVEMNAQSNLRLMSLNIEHMVLKLSNYNGVQERIHQLENESGLVT